MIFTFFRSVTLRSLPEGLRTLAIAGVIVLGHHSPVVANITQATLTEILDGTEVFIDNRGARVNDVARAQQQIRTGSSRVQLRFNTGAIGRLSQNSQMIVAGQCFNIQQGTILVHGNANGCTRSRRLSVRGTTYLVEHTPQGETHIIVLEGEVEVTPDPTAAGAKDFFPKFPRIPIFGSDSDEESDAENDLPQEEAITLESGEEVSISRDGRRGPIARLSQARFERILNGQLFRGFASELSGILKIREVFQIRFPNVPFPLFDPFRQNSEED